MPTVLAVRVSRRGKVTVLWDKPVRDADGYREILKWLGTAMRSSKGFAAEGSALDRVYGAVRIAKQSQLPAVVKSSVLRVLPSAQQLAHTVAAAAHLSVDPFHVIDETESLHGVVRSLLVARLLCAASHPHDWTRLQSLTLILTSTLQERD